MNKSIVVNLFIILFCTTAYTQNPQWYTYNSANSGLPDNFVFALTIETNGAKWIGTGYGGLGRFDGINWTVYNSSNSPLLDNWISALGLNGDQELWIGTVYGGLAQLIGSNWTLYSESNTGMPITSILSIEIKEGINAKFFGTYEGLVKFHDNQWSVYNEMNSGIPSNQVWSIAIEDTNLWWVGTAGGLARYDGNWTTYNIGNSGLPGDHINAIAIEDDGTAWFGTIYGLASFDGNNWTTYTTLNSGLPADHVSGIYIDSENNKWIATFGATGGLAKFDGNNWTVYNSSNTTLDNYLRSIAGEDNGNIWVGSNGYGLSVLNENGLTSLEQIDEYILDDYTLEQNYPNPFNPSTTISYSIPNSSFVTIKIYDVLGNQIAELVNEEKLVGTYEVSFDASNLSTGTYFYQLQATDPESSSGQGFVETRKMILIK
jgi:ligand-binding sensor domain-containing protein